MALDGFTVSALCAELNDKLNRGRITKIAQPENDEILLTVKGERGQFRLLICASATLPFVCLTENNKVSPLSAPNFCMLLRKHLQNGKILSVTQPSLERVLMIEAEHLNEMGDPEIRKLVVELMGKHSNIIFVNENDVIIDSIKHVSSAVSSVREVLPGRGYFIPQTTEKLDPHTATYDAMAHALSNAPMPLKKAVYSILTGFSPVMSEELLYRCGLDSDRSANALTPEETQALFDALQDLMDTAKRGAFSPVIIYDNKEPVDFAPVPLKIYEDCRSVSDPSISHVIETFYAEKNALTRIRQKSADLRHIVSTALERNVRKYDLQQKQLHDAQKKDKYKIWGELLNTYGYKCESGDTEVSCENYYTGETVTIPLDPTKSALENARHYFDKYGKLKRTAQAASEQAAETKKEIDHLSSVLASLDIAQEEEDLIQIRDELCDCGYIRRRGTKRRATAASRPFHYVSSDGFDIFVGKNNYQNDELTFKTAAGNDWWFHAKGIPGSHVIVRSENRELPDRVFEEAAALAAWYSAGRDADKVEVDYVRKKEVKKPSGAAPGFVVYYTNYSLIARPSTGNVRLVES